MDGKESSIFSKNSTNFFMGSWSPSYLIQSDRTPGAVSFIPLGLFSFNRCSSAWMRKEKKVSSKI